jgi:hypothetical protein
MFKFFVKGLLFTGILAICHPVLADRVASLYDVDIEVNDESSTTRDQAFATGLDEVFVRISGNSAVLESLERPPASRYVKKFSYESITEETDEAGQDSGEQTQKHRLKVQYNGHLMEKYLQDNGFATWGQYRPDVVVWLVVRDGRNEYVLKQPDSSLIKKAMDEAMQRRGIPGHWPLYDKKDRKILNVSDIRGGFQEPVAEASRRYSRGPALTGSMIWNGKNWITSWSLLVEGESRHWTLDMVDHRQLVNAAVDQAADMLGEVFAINASADTQQGFTVQLDISEVDTIERYRYVEDHLSGLSMVEIVRPTRIDGQNASFEVSLRSREESFLSLLRNDSKLIEIQPPAVQPQSRNDFLTMPAGASDQPGDDSMGNMKPETSGVFQVVSEITTAENVILAKPVARIPVYYYRLNR